MKVELNKFERELILESIYPCYLCTASCYIGYKRINCTDEDENGNPRCKLLQTIDELRKKLKDEDYIPTQQYIKNIDKYTRGEIDE